MNSAK